MYVQYMLYVVPSIRVLTFNTYIATTELLHNFKFKKDGKNKLSFFGRFDIISSEYYQNTNLIG